MCHELLCLYTILHGRVFIDRRSHHANTEADAISFFAGGAFFFRNTNKHPQIIFLTKLGHIFVHCYGPKLMHTLSYCNAKHDSEQLLQKTLYLSSLLRIEILMKKIPSNKFSK